MEYKVEAFISKIKSPVVCVTEDGEMEYANGSELYAHSFHKHYIVDSLDVREGKVVLSMKENKPSPPMNWIGEEAVDTNSSGFPKMEPDESWVKDYKRNFGEEPSFF